MIISDEEEEARSPLEVFFEMLDAFPSVGGRWFFEFVVIDFSPGEGRGGEFEHFEALLVAGARFLSLVWRSPTRDEDDLVKLERVDCFLSDFKMPLMDGVKGPPKEGDFLELGHRF